MAKVALRIPDLHACTMEDLKFVEGIIKDEIERRV